MNLVIYIVFIHKENVEIANNNIKNAVEKNIDYRINNCEWYGTSNKKEWIEFNKSNFRFKNEVKQYYDIGINGHLRHIITYRQAAINCYLKIAKILKKDSFNHSFNIDLPKTNSILGYYKAQNIVGTSKFYQKNNRLYVSYSEDKKTDSEIEFYIISKNKLLSEEGLFITYYFNSMGTVIMKSYTDTMVKFRDL